MLTIRDFCLLFFEVIFSFLYFEIPSHPSAYVAMYSKAGFSYFHLAVLHPIVSFKRRALHLRWEHSKCYLYVGISLIICCSSFCCCSAKCSSHLFCAILNFDGRSNFDFAKVISKLAGSVFTSHWFPFFFNFHFL